MLKVTAKFITSAARKEQFLCFDKPLIAVSGKSNVGKSSFINALANQNKLAKVSKDPGRTRLINYFDFGEFVLADLPGYGYAKVSREEKARWGKLMEEFFAQAEIAHVFALADIRHSPTADDKQMIDFLYYNALPFTVVAIKADKLSRAAGLSGIKKIAAEFKCGCDNVLAVSSQTKQGLDAVIARIEQVLNTYGGQDD